MIAVLVNSPVIGKSYLERLCMTVYGMCNKVIITDDLSRHSEVLY